MDVMRTDNSFQPAGMPTAGGRERKSDRASRGALVGEKFTEDRDPKRSTVSQKTWLYCTDPALKYRDAVPVLDEEEFQTSLRLPDSSEEWRNAKSHARVRTFTRTADPTTASRADGINIFMDD